MDRAGGLEEVHLSVRDLGKMHAFYRDTLGFQEEFYHEGRMAGYDTGGAMLVLRCSDSPASGVALTLGCDDIEASMGFLRERGVRFTKPLEEGHWGARIAGFEDPEGNPIYLEEGA